MNRLQTSAALAAICILAPLAAADAALIGRAPLTPGGSDFRAYYDDVLDITWVASSTLGATQDFGITGITENGTMRWDTAQSWVAAMGAANYLGYDNWRLPMVAPVNGVGFQYARSYDGTTDRGYGLGAPGSLNAGTTASEMAHLYYTTLGNKAFCGPQSSGDICSIQDGGGLTNRGPFTDLPEFTFWAGQEYFPGGDLAWVFRFGPQTGFFGGNQGGSLKVTLRHAWAVGDGDIAVIPVPAAFWLFGSALGVLGWQKRRSV